jgi:hypothetical protein
MKHPMALQKWAECRSKTVKEVFVLNDSGAMSDSVNPK